jgi:hypothetical protein
MGNRSEGLIGKAERESFLKLKSKDMKYDRLLTYELSNNSLFLGVFHDAFSLHAT